MIYAKSVEFLQRVDMRYLLVVVFFLAVSCSQEESKTESSSGNQSAGAGEEEQTDTEDSPQSIEEQTSVMPLETIVLIPRIGITCRQYMLWFIPLNNKQNLTCDKGTPVCGRRASVDSSSELKPYCVIGDSEEEGAELTMIPPEVASPYCKDIPFKGGDGGEIECFEYKGDL